MYFIKPKRFSHAPRHLHAVPHLHTTHPHDDRTKTEKTEIKQKVTQPVGVVGGDRDVLLLCLHPPRGWPASLVVDCLLVAVGWAVLPHPLPVACCVVSGL